MELESVIMVVNEEGAINFYRMNSNDGPRLIKLIEAKNVAKYSFHCHKSVTYLDLNLQEYSSYNKRFDTARKFCHKYVCTDQGLQNFLRPSNECAKTILFQNFHVDVIKVQEPALENAEYSTVNLNRIYDCDAVFNVAPEKYFYEFHLIEFIINALEKNTEKVPIIKLCLKLMKHEDFHFCMSKPGSKSDFIPYVVNHCPDFELLLKVLNRLSFDVWIIYGCEPDELENFLNRVRALKKGVKVLDEDIIYMGFATSMCKNVEMLLRYQNCPKLSSRSYQYAFRSMIAHRPRLESTELKIFFDRTENNFQALLIYLTFMLKSDSAFQSLRLLWRSIPTCFITSDEFKDIFEPMLVSSEIEEVYNFYTNAIEQPAPSYQPRMLKHYCRLKIRTVLYEQEQLYNGIDELGLPLDLQLYLKLKK